MATNDPREVSGRAKEDKSHGGEGCGRYCPSEFCLHHGSKFSLYTFCKGEKCPDLVLKEPQDLFLKKLFQTWEEKKDSGLFHHDIAACDIKMLSGEFDFIVRLIEGRDLKKRPTEYRLDAVLQPFDENRFNFTKIAQAEVIFRFEESERDLPMYLDTDPAPACDALNIVAINVSPIGYGHVLLIPRILKLLPQRMDLESLLLALYMAREAASPHFRIGYNSLGAFATINHLHFQAFHLPMFLPAEKASTEHITTLRSGVKIFRLSKYPVSGLVFERGMYLQDLAYAVSSTCTFLEENNQPYNVMISDSGKRLFVFMQCYAERQALGKVNQEILDTQVNPAAWEISGYLVLKRKKLFEETSEKHICRLFAAVSLCKEKFQELEESILQALQAIQRLVSMLEILRLGSKRKNIKPALKIMEKFKIS